MLNGAQLCLIFILSAFWATTVFGQCQEVAEAPSRQNTSRSYEFPQFAEELSRETTKWSNNFDAKTVSDDSFFHIVENQFVGKPVDPVQVLAFTLASFGPGQADKLISSLAERQNERMVFSIRDFRWNFFGSILKAKFYSKKPSIWWGGMRPDLVVFYLNRREVIKDVGEFLKIAVASVEAVYHLKSSLKPYSGLVRYPFSKAYRDRVFHNFLSREILISKLAQRAKLHSHSKEQGRLRGVSILSTLGNAFASLAGRTRQGIQELLKNARIEDSAFYGLLSKLNFRTDIHEPLAPAENRAVMSLIRNRLLFYLARVLIIGTFSVQTGVTAIKLHAMNEWVNSTDVRSSFSDDEINLLIQSSQETPEQLLARLKQIDLVSDHSLRKQDAIDFSSIEAALKDLMQ